MQCFSEIQGQSRANQQNIKLKKKKKIRMSTWQRMRKYEWVLRNRKTKESIFSFLSWHTKQWIEAKTRAIIWYVAWFKDLPRKKKQRLCILILRIITVTNHVLIVSIITTNSAIIEPVPSAKKLINKIKSPSSIINMLKLLLYVRTFILLFEQFTPSLFTSYMIQ